MDEIDKKQNMIWYLQSEVSRLKEENKFLREQLEYKTLGRPQVQEPNCTEGI